MTVLVIVLVVYVAGWVAAFRLAWRQLGISDDLRPGDGADLIVGCMLCGSVALLWPLLAAMWPITAGLEKLANRFLARRAVKREEKV